MGPAVNRIAISRCQQQIALGQPPALRDRTGRGRHPGVPDEEEASIRRLRPTAHGGRPQAQHDSGRPLALEAARRRLPRQVTRVSQKRFRVGVSAGGDVHYAQVSDERFDEHSGQMVVNGQRFRILTATHGPIHLVEVDGVSQRVSLDEGGVVRAAASTIR